MTQQLAVFSTSGSPLVTAAGHDAQTRFWEFFAANTASSTHAAPTRRRRANF